MKREQRLVDLKIEQSGKPTVEKMTSHGSVSDLPADIVSVDRVLIRLVCLSVNFFSVKDFSATTRVRILKLGTSLDSDELYCVTRKQPHIA